MAGLPKKYAKMGFKKGWREYRKAQRGRKGSRPKSRSKSTMAKNKRRRGFLNASTIMKFARIAALVGPAAGVAMGAGSPSDKVKAGIQLYTGYHLDTKTWRWDKIVQGWTPYISTLLLTKGIQKLSGIIGRL